MRKGKNVSLGANLKSARAYHRIIIPLYIPHEKEFYEQSYKIFEMCLDSIHKTTVNNVVISILCNACAPIVKERVFNWFIKGE